MFTQIHITAQHGGAFDTGPLEPVIDWKLCEDCLPEINRGIGKLFTPTGQPGEGG
jgi:hypothetical protein